ncbi:MAG: DUF4331 domain-containing protein [Rhodocyclaceae bacterium]
MKRAKLLVAPLIAACALGWLAPAQAASHREAPLIANDPTADITDVYFFRSWENPGNVVLMMNVIPGQEPSSGPNYFNFDDDVLYTFHFDTNADGNADDVNVEVRFKTEFRGTAANLKLPLSYVAVPPIAKLDGPGSEGLSLRQSYTVTQVTRGRRTNLGQGTMFAVPSNVGPRTMPDYEDLRSQGVYPLRNGGKVFAGQADETFYIDLGAVFDTVNLRRAVPILSPAEDGDDTRSPYGNDAFSGFNVNTIAIEVPISAISSNPNAVIGMYASTSRQQVKLLGPRSGPVNTGQFVQVSRMANPLVNELIIGTGQKDEWNAAEPERESRFLDFYLNSRLASALNLLFSTSFPTANRVDLVNALLKYGNQPQTGNCANASPCSELLRLNLAVAPTPPANQKRLAVLAGDNAGWPNGRRPNDDVTDIALRVVAGALLGPVPALGDGVNFNLGAQGSNLTANGIYTVFPYLPTPFDGRNRRHIDCGESDANAC